MTASGEQHARSESGPSGSSQSRRVTPTAFGSERRRATALSTPPLIATATRPGERCARKTPPIAFASASTASVSPPTAAASSSVSPASSRSKPGASASTIRSPSTRSRTAAHSPPRLESPKSSCTTLTVVRSTYEHPPPRDRRDRRNAGYRRRRGRRRARGWLRRRERRQAEHGQERLHGSRRQVLLHRGPGSVACTAGVLRTEHHRLGHSR